MKVKFRLIRNGKPVEVQYKEYDGSIEANKRQIQDDQFTGMDPAQRALSGHSADWVEATIVE